MGYRPADSRAPRAGGRTPSPPRRSPRSRTPTARARPECAVRCPRCRGRGSRSCWERRAPPGDRRAGGWYAQPGGRRPSGSAWTRRGRRPARCNHGRRPRPPRRNPATPRASDRHRGSQRHRLRDRRRARAPRSAQRRCRFPAESCSRAQVALPSTPSMAPASTKKPPEIRPSTFHAQRSLPSGWRQLTAAGENAGSGGMLLRQGPSQRIDGSPKWGPTHSENARSPRISATWIADGIENTSQVCHTTGEITRGTRSCNQIGLGASPTGAGAVVDLDHDRGEPGLGRQDRKADHGTDQRGDRELSSG